MQNNVGVFSDVHSNSFALQRMFENEPNIRHWFCLGDFIGLLSNPNEVIDLLILHNVIVIRGDHETALLNGNDLPQSYNASKVLEIQRREIYPHHLEFIEKCPDSRVIEIEGITYNLIHDLTLGIGNKYKFDFEKITVNDKQKSDVFLFGNTHLPQIVTTERNIFLNPGSIGFPITAKPQFTYIVYSPEDNWGVLKTIQFSKEPLVESLSEKNYPSVYLDYVKGEYKWPKKS